MQQRFGSKIDGKFVALGVGLPILIGLVFLADGLLYGGPPWWSVLPLALVVLMVAWLLSSTWYGFEAASLVVRSGPFAWRIPLEQIFAVRESHSVRSGPAMSMDRLEIRFGDDRHMLISPKDKAGFLAELHRQAPQLTRGGQVRGPRLDDLT